MNLRNRMLASYFLVSTIPIIVISSIIFKVSADSISESSEQFASLYVSEVTSSLEGFERGYDRISRAVLGEADILQILNSKPPSAMSAMVENQAAVKSFFVHMASIYPEIRSFALRGQNGFFFAWCQDPGSIDEGRLAEQDWFKRIEARDEYPFFISPVHDRSYYTGDREGTALTIGRKIWSYSGKYIGAIYFDIGSSQLAKLNPAFLDLGRKNSIRLVIADYSGGTIYDSASVTGVPRRPAATAGDKEVLRLSQESSSGRLTAMVEIPYDELLKKIRKVGGIMVLVNLACLVAIAFFAFSYSYSIARPIRELQLGMRKVEDGDYSSLIKRSSSSDEMSSLFDSYNAMVLRIRELLENVYIAEINEKHARLRALQSQINPHMLYNTLESIRMKAVVQGQEQIAEMIKVLARMFKHSLKDDSRRNTVRDELRYASDYLYIQNVRHDGIFALEETLSDTIKGTPLIPMVFQPIIENSIKHGYRGRQAALSIVIRHEFITPSIVKITIADDGLGVSAERLERLRDDLATNGPAEAGDEDRLDSVSGIGLKNLAQRLRLQYGEEYSMSVESEAGRGFKVELLLPVAHNASPAEAYDDGGFAL